MSRHLINFAKMDCTDKVSIGKLISFLDFKIKSSSDIFMFFQNATTHVDSAWANYLIEKNIKK